VRWPSAEIEVDATLVEQLVREQHPDLIDDAITEIPSGFDNTIWRLGDSLVIRVPRRLAAVPLIESEQRWLPELAQSLPLSVPTPIRVGQPSALFPWPWTITRWIEGMPGNLVGDAIRGRSAARLGGFFRALHRDAPVDAPTNPFRSVLLSAQEGSFRARLEDIGAVIDRPAVETLWNASRDASPWVGTPQWIHGDPHTANLIFRDDILVGVIDFGDMCAGDPATDLAGNFLTLPFESIDDFFGAYGPVDDATLVRTLGWAVHFGLMFVLLGASDEPTYGPIGQRAIENALAYSIRRN
jgi:aminoglycoside phosphotransferase (APT) family kinase protein